MLSQQQQLIKTNKFKGFAKESEQILSEILQGTTPKTLTIEEKTFFFKLSYLLELRDALIRERGPKFRPVICAADYGFTKEGNFHSIKCFSFFSTRSSFSNWYEKCSYKHIYQVIQPIEHELIFEFYDIDCLITKKEKDIFEKLNQTSIIDAFVQAWKKYHGAYLLSLPNNPKLEPIYSIEESCRESVKGEVSYFKLSFHIKNYTVLFRDIYSARIHASNFNRFILANARMFPIFYDCNKKPFGLDTGVYKSKQQMRLLGSCKLNSEQPLKIYKNYDPYSYSLYTTFQNTDLTNQIESNQVWIIKHDIENTQMRKHKVPSFVIQNKQNELRTLMNISKDQHESMVTFLSKALSILARLKELPESVSSCYQFFFNVGCALASISKQCNLKPKDLQNLHNTFVTDALASMKLPPNSYESKFTIYDLVDKNYNVSMQTIFFYIRTLDEEANEDFKKLCKNMKFKKCKQLCRPLLNIDSFEDVNYAKQNCVYFRIENKYVSEMLNNPEIANQFANSQVVMIKSLTGTGKTKLVIDFIEQNPKDKFLVILSRITLCHDFYRNLQKFGFTLYDSPEGLQNQDRYIICINSITNCYKLRSSDYDYILIDEVESLIEQILTDVRPSVLLMQLLDIMTNNQTKKIFMIDYRLSFKTLMLVEEYWKQYFNYRLNFLEENLKRQHAKEQTLLVENTFKNEQKKVAFMNGKNFFEFFDKQLEALQDKEKIYVCCDTKSNVLALMYYIQIKFPHLSEEICILVADPLIVADRNIIIEKQLFKRILIVSPTVTYGVNIEDEYKYIFAFYQNSTILFEEQFQQISRIRNVTEKIVIYSQLTFPSWPKNVYTLQQTEDYIQGLFLKHGEVVNKLQKRDLCKFNIDIQEGTISFNKNNLLAKLQIAMVYNKIRHNFCPKLQLQSYIFQAYNNVDISLDDNEKPEQTIKELFDQSKKQQKDLINTKIGDISTNIARSYKENLSMEIQELPNVDKQITMSFNKIARKIFNEQSINIFNKHFQTHLYEFLYIVLNPKKLQYVYTLYNQISFFVQCSVERKLDKLLGSQMITKEFKMEDFVYCDFNSEYGINYYTSVIAFVQNLTALPYHQVFSEGFQEVFKNKFFQFQEQAQLQLTPVQKHLNRKSQEDIQVNTLSGILDHNYKNSKDVLDKNPIVKFITIAMFQTKLLRVSAYATNQISFLKHYADTMSQWNISDEQQEKNKTKEKISFLEAFMYELNKVLGGIEMAFLKTPEEVDQQPLPCSGKVYEFFDCEAPDTDEEEQQ